MKLIILLDVLSWEERARILSKVWILGIVLALFAVAVFLYFQHKKKKKEQQRIQKRGMQAKAKTTQDISYAFLPVVKVSDALLAQFGFKNKVAKDLICCYSERSQYYLAAFTLRKETKQKFLLSQWYLHQTNDQRALHWLLRKTMVELREMGVKSVGYCVSENESDDFVNMMESYGFRRVALSKKDREAFKFMLKLDL